MELGKDVILKIGDVEIGCAADTSIEITKQSSGWKEPKPKKRRRMTTWDMVVEGTMLLNQQDEQAYFNMVPVMSDEDLEVFRKALEEAAESGNYMDITIGDPPRPAQIKVTRSENGFMCELVVP